MRDVRVWFVVRWAWRGVRAESGGARVRGLIEAPDTFRRAVRSAEFRFVLDFNGGWVCGIKCV